MKQYFSNNCKTKQFTKNEVSIKDFFSKCDQFNGINKFKEEIFNEKLCFFVECLVLQKISLKWVRSLVLSMELNYDT